MATPILNLTELAASSTNAYAIANEMLRDTEESNNDFLAVDLMSGNVTITNTTPNWDFSRFFLFRAQNNTVSRDLTFPANKRHFAVENTGSATLNVKLGTTTLTVAAGVASQFYADGTANGLIKFG